MKTFIQLIVLSILCISFANANIINVPGDATTIQEGIDLANPGDTVLVQEGTYLENIYFKGKPITVASLFLMDGDRSHIANTIIDGSNPSHPDSGSVVYFINGEDTASVLAGFTITGGSGTLTTEGRAGGGICALFSGAYIRNNYIEDNHIQHNDNAFGGGIYVWNLDQRDCIIEKNVIRNNTIVSTDVSLFSLGGGMYTNGVGTDMIRISQNVIMDNTVTAPFAWGGGITPSNWNDVNYIIINNFISGNVINASVIGGSGGIDIYDHWPVVRNNVIANNSAPLGGGMSIEFSAAEENMRGGRGAVAEQSEASIHNKTSLTEIANLSNNTLVGNSAGISGGGIEITNASPQIMNFIIWGNDAPNNPQISDTGDVQYSDIEGGMSGTGNMNSDPAFIDTTFYFLSANSPCVDGGNPDPMYNDPEDPNNPGFALWPALGDLTSDMGAYGGPGAYWDSSFAIVGIGEQANRQQIPTQFKLFQNAPNPFNPSTTISYQLSIDSNVELTIYNLLGQKIKTLVKERKAAGNYTASWDGRDARGVV